MDIEIRRRDGLLILFEMPEGFDLRTEIVRLDKDRIVAACPDMKPVVLRLDTATLEELHVQ